MLRRKEELIICKCGVLKKIFQVYGKYESDRRIEPEYDMSKLVTFSIIPLNENI